MSADEVRAEVRLTNLDQPLFDGAQVTKRQFVDYLDTVWHWWRSSRGWR